MASTNLSLRLISVSRYTDIDRVWSTAFGYDIGGINDNPTHVLPVVHMYYW